MYYKNIFLTGPQVTIGYEDENLPTRVIIDISDLTKYGTGTTVLEVKRPCDREAYIAEQTEVDGNNFYWYPTKGDLEVSGLLKCQVKAVIGDQIVKTRVYSVQVSSALTGDGTLSGVVPDALQTFVESASGSEDAAKVSAEEAKKAEEAAKASETATKKSETNAKASETAAKASEIAAAKSASDADASAQAAADSAAEATELRERVEALEQREDKDTVYDDTAIKASVKANTDALGGHTVKSDVPADAKFTDTVYNDTAVREMIAGKQDTLTFDDTPTADSSNPVTSGGVKAYVDSKAGGSGSSGGEESTIVSENVLASGTVASGTAAWTEIDTGLTVGDLRQYKRFALRWNFKGGAYTRVYFGIVIFQSWATKNVVLFDFIDKEKKYADFMMSLDESKSKVTGSMLDAFFSYDCKTYPSYLIADISKISDDAVFKFQIGTSATSADGTWEVRGLTK